MSQRAIVRDRTKLGGRWSLDGTGIPIADIRADHRLSGRGVTEQLYQTLNLTPEEYAAVLDFAFPVMRESAVNSTQAVAVLECMCGEDTSFVMFGPSNTVVCPCSRTWQLNIEVVLLNG
jgi:hypothetical protein